MTVAVEDGVHVAVFMDHLRSFCADFPLHLLNGLAVKVDDFALSMVVLSAAVSDQTLEHISSNAPLAQANLGVWGHEKVRGHGYLLA